jgi:integrase/recombinase XerD
VLIKTLLYTGVRVAELVAIRLGDVDLDACRIRITAGKGNRDPHGPLPGCLPGGPRAAHRHPARHLSWLTAQGIDDALIQPHSGHEYRQSLEVYSRLSLADALQRYDEVIDRYRV